MERVVGWGIPHTAARAREGRAVQETPMSRFTRTALAGASALAALALITGCASGAYAANTNGELVTLLCAA